MLDDLLKPYDSKGNKVHLAHLTKYNDTLTRHRLAISDRHGDSKGYETLGVSMLKFILNIADVSRITKYESDYDRYDLIQYEAENYGRHLDVTSGSNVRKNKFIYSNGSCQELFIPVTSIDTIGSLPFDKGWEAWKSVRAVRLIDIDSNELTFQTYNDYIKYRSEIPRYAIFSIDPLALVMQYARYLSDVPEQDRSIIPVYLHQYVLNHGVLRDMQNLWLRDRYLDAFRTGYSQSIKDTGVSNKGIYGYIGTEYNHGMNDLNGIIDRVKNGNLKVRDVLESLPLSGSNARSHFHYLRSSTDLPITGVQYDWVEFLRDMKWLMLVYHITILNQSSPEYTKMKRTILNQVPLVINDRISSKAPTSLLKNIIDTKLSQLQSMM